MTDTEIMKALECCSNDDNEVCVNNCPLYKTEECCEELPMLALNLISRQQAEIETAKQTAIREFAERLNAKLENSAREDCYGTKYFIVGEGVVNRVVNEMFGNPEQLKGKENA